MREAFQRSEIIESPRKIRKTISSENQRRNSVIVKNPNSYRSDLTENSKRRRKNMVKLDKAKSEARIAKFVEKKRRELLFPQFS